MESGHLLAAQPHFAAHLALCQGLAKEDPASFKFREILGTSHDSLAVWSEMRGLIAESLAHDRAAQEIFRGLTAHDPANQLLTGVIARSSTIPLISNAGDDPEGGYHFDLWREGQATGIDPRIYNHGEPPPDGGKLSWWRRFLRWWR